ncbi:MAG: pyruvate formate-lyase activating enzyme [Monoraphidium minutum]|nr:MAG: pyruvate formate-lyase activating enzyme [Monoraphidium minutum]
MGTRKASSFSGPFSSFNSSSNSSSIPATAAARSYALPALVQPEPADDAPLLRPARAVLPRRAAPAEAIPESFSTVDGPGVRFLVFTMGCAMRCSFCSNPDTWSPHGGELVSSKDIAGQIRRVLPYLKSSQGGLTCSGGEPMLQPQFTATLFQEARAMGLTTTLDTTGQGTKHKNWDAVLPHTDSVLFCIKSLDPEKYQGLTGLKQIGALRFARELTERAIPFWARYVLIPGHTDSARDIAMLAEWAACMPTLQGIELLPYHVYGKNKWEALGLAYPLEGVETPPPADVRRVVAALEAAGLPVMCDASAPAGLSAAHTGAHS